MNQERLKLYRIDIKYVRNLAKIDDNNKLIGVLNFNNMIPVCDECLVPLSLKAEKNDTPDIRHYKNMAKKQLAWCQKNQDSIVKKVSWTKN